MNKLWDNLKQPNIPLAEVSAGEERGDIKIHIFEGKMAENSPNLKIQTIKAKKAQWTLNTGNNAYNYTKEYYNHIS